MRGKVGYAAQPSQKSKNRAVAPNQPEAPASDGEKPQGADKTRAMAKVADICGSYRTRWFGAFNFCSSNVIRWRSSTASSSAYMAVAKWARQGKIARSFASRSLPKVCGP